MFRRFRCHCLSRWLALALLAFATGLPLSPARADEPLPNLRAGVAAPALDVPPNQSWDAGVINFQSPDMLPSPSGEMWIAPPGDMATPGEMTPVYTMPQAGAMSPPGTMMPAGPSVTTYTDPAWGCQPVTLPSPTDAWYWQVLPDGIIYHSYWAGVHEPRLSAVFQHTSNVDSFIDGNVGGRVGLLRYGTGNAIFPQGWQLDVEAAAMLRLTLDYWRDFESADYRVGIPLTYGIENWQYKLGVYHLSSHLGDEFAINNPGSLADRINYVRDEVTFGTSYYPVPYCRLYGEIGYAFNTDGGAEPWEIQFGTEWAQAGPTGPRGTPFFAINGHLREEVDWGGDVSTQAGWLWRGNSGQVFRLGLHYFNGKSSQYQSFNRFEEQIGFGLWYDF